MTEQRVPAIPAAVAGLNAEWLTSALRSRGALRDGDSVSSFTSTILGEGEGFLGELARVELQYAGAADGAPRTVIAKFPTMIPENRGLGTMLGVYEHEIRFYTELAEHVGVRVPDCYFGDLDPEPRSAVIMGRVLGLLPDRVTLMLLDRLTLAAGKSARRFGLLIEDLDTARVGDQVAGATLEDAEVALVALARLHARFWESPLLDRDWLPRPSDAPRITHGLFERAWPVFEQRFRDRLTPQVRRNTDWVAEHGVALLNRVARPPVTLVHGDYRLDNLMFNDGDGEEPVTIIDWQGVMVANPMVDVAYFIRPNLPPELADSAEQDLLALYHRTLVEGGVTGYDFDRCRADYNLGQLFVLHLGVILIGTLDLSHERGIAIVDRAIERTLVATPNIDPDSVDL